MADPAPAFRPGDLLRALEEHRVQYVVIGGLAATLHGSPYPTADVDITPATDRENLGRLAEALRELGARLRVTGTDELVDWPLDARSFDQGTTWTFVTTAGYLDVCLRPDGTGGFADLARDATREDLGDDLAVLVASLGDVIRSKEAANRDKDLRMLPGLRVLQTEIARSTRQEDR
jgi:hypothetical protein